MLAEYILSRVCLICGIFSRLFFAKYGVVGLQLSLSDYDGREDIMLPMLLSSSSSSQKYTPFPLSP